MPSVSARREAVSAWLKQSREAAGLTTTDLGLRLGITQTRVSRMERGVTFPPPEIVRSWAEATRAAGADDMVREATELSAEVRTNPAALAAGLVRRQQALKDTLAAATSMSELCIAVVPGLLQVSAYTAHLVERMAAITGATDTAEATAARVANMATLYDRTKTFNFVITEGALHYQAGPPDVMTAQAAKIIDSMSLPNVTVAVVPAAAALTTPVQSAFALFDSDDWPLILVELLAGEVTFGAPAEVQLYRDQFAALQRAAIRGKRRTADFIRAAMIPQ